MTACRTCGSRQVNRLVVRSMADADREIVIVTCAGCDSRRNTYTRRRSGA